MFGTRPGQGLLPLLITLSLVLQACGPDDSGADASGSLAAACTAAPHLQRILDTGRTAGEVPAAAMSLTGPDGCRWHGASGTLGVADPTPLSTQDLFRAGSVTKTFVAALTLMLRDDGAWSLDDTIARWMPPGFPYADQITLRHLLSHTSGLGEYIHSSQFVAHAADPWTPDQLVALIATLPRGFAPGTDFRYCNSNYVVLGYLVTQLTNRPVSHVLRTRMLTPLGLRATFFGGEEAARTLSGYAVINHAWADVTDRVHLTGAYAAGALVTTAFDLGRFAHALFTGRLLSAVSLQEMVTPSPASVARGTPYGLGVAVGQGNDGPVWGHTGNITGFGSTFRFWASQRIAVAVLTNRDGFDPSSIAISARQLWR